MEIPVRMAKMQMLTRKPFKEVVKLDVRDSVGDFETCCTRAVNGRLRILVALLVSVASAYGQSSFEITPLVGGRFGGTINLQQEGQAGDSVARLDDAKLDDAFSFGVAAGIRYDADDCEGCNVVEFRWMRQNTHLGFKENALDETFFRPAVTLDHFLGDFIREFPIRETDDRVKPFVFASLGVVRMSAPAESRTRFEFGIGAGVNVFPQPQWGFRFQVEYLPIVMLSEIQKVICMGSCIVALNGGVVNQFTVNAGPIIRF